MANNSLRQRLLRDIAEIQTKPYPNIALRVQDDDISKACLILTVEGYGNMHLTVQFPGDYPLKPPKIQMNSAIQHPNIFGSYICSSILNTTQGYTSAYTLKSIAIQLLSFFSSDRVEQEGGGYSDLAEYKSYRSYIFDVFVCPHCHFGSVSSESSGSTNPGQGQILGRNARRRKAKKIAAARAHAAVLVPPTPNITGSSSSSVVTMDLAEPVEASQPRGIVDMKIPNEVVLMICDQLDTEDLMIFAQAWARIPHVMNKFDVIRTRELQCFCLKEDYLSVKLGVGVHVDLRTRSFESEFDLLSEEGFRTHKIRRSTQGREFEHWLPLPISNGHWRKVIGDASASITKLAASANIQNPTQAKILYQFMNDIVVKLNQQATRTKPADAYQYQYTDLQSIQSSLTHASEKAIESYFHLFHLLVCLATANPAIVTSANALIQAFISGRTSKADCPNLGHLLVAALISEVNITESVIKAIIKETITRNVVWTLNNNPELAYLEPSAFSEYRLHHTFQASKTSYRLLMFLNLFRKAAVGNPRKPLQKLRDEAFERHGAPPRGSAKSLANAIKKIHEVNRFPDFLAMMDIKAMPSKQQFNTYLHKCIKESEEKGYSRMPITQGQALCLRKAEEPGVEVAEGVVESYMDPCVMRAEHKTFFPQPRDSGGRGHGRGRGRGRG
jgi:ubiquitin-protein ligase